MAFVPIRSRRRAKQLVDSGGMEFGERLWPTDFDAVIEWRDRAWLLFEVKMYDVDVPSGQRLAIERFVKDVHKAGKHALAVVVQHCVTDPEETVTLAKCRVREVYASGEFRWRPPREPIDAQRMAHEYIEYVEHMRG